ncbi:MAG: HPP family protein [Anaerolineae bacterium]|nr:HPP family protein [Anaerolineae bacterium]
MDDLRSKWKNYFWQSACATLAIFVVLALLSVDRAVIIASIGATTFIVFMTPDNPFATPRNVIGGHMVGVVTGALFALTPRVSPLVEAVWYALAVGMCLFLMAATNTEHPPAAGTALSVAISGFSWRVAVAVLASVVLFSFIQRLFRPYLKDL